LNSILILKYNNNIYIFKEELVYKELLKRYYNNILTGYFNIKKIIKLFIRKYF